MVGVKKRSGSPWLESRLCQLRPRKHGIDGTQNDSSVLSWQDRPRHVRPLLTTATLTPLQKRQRRNTNDYVGAQGMHNQRFADYYKAQNIVPDDEWDQLMDAFRRPLPTTFRITGSREYAIPFHCRTTHSPDAKASLIPLVILSKQYMSPS